MGNDTFKKCLRAIKSIFCFGLVGMDQFTDVMAAVTYYYAEDYFWFALGLFFALVPSIINNIVLVWRFWNLSKEKLKISKGMMICLAATQLLVYWSLSLAIMDALKEDHEQDTLLKDWAKFIRLLENICESAPQAVLQSYVIGTKHALGEKMMQMTMAHGPPTSAEMFWVAFPYMSVGMSILSLSIGFTFFTFGDVSKLYQPFFYVFSLLSAGIRLCVCVLLGAGQPGYLWLTILSAYGTSVLLCTFYVFFPITKYKTHRLLPFTCINATLFNTINWTGIFLNIVYIVCFKLLYDVIQLNLFCDIMHILWHGCGVLLGINVAFVLPVVFFRLDAVNWLFLPEGRMRKLWTNMYVF